MASGASARRKGVDGERESADLFRAAHYGVIPLQNNVRDHGDYLVPISVVTELLVDSKRQERLKLPEWSRQVEAVARDGEVPAVVYRSSGEPWRVSMRLDDLLRLLA